MRSIINSVATVFALAVSFTTCNAAVVVGSPLHALPDLPLATVVAGRRPNASSLVGVSAIAVNDVVIVTAVPTATITANARLPVVDCTAEVICVDYMTCGQRYERCYDKYCCDGIDPSFPSSACESASMVAATVVNRAAKTLSPDSK